MTMLRDDTGRGTPGDARCAFGVLRTSRESRRIEVLPSGDVVAYRLLDAVELWHPTSIPLRDDTQLRLVRSARSLDALLVPPAAATTPAGVALATSAAAGAAAPASSHLPARPSAPAHHANRGNLSEGEGGEPVRGLFSSAGALAAASSSAAAVTGGAP